MTQELLQRLMNAPLHGDRELDMDLHVEFCKSEIKKPGVTVQPELHHVEILYSTDRPKTVEAARGEHDNKDGYDKWSISPRLWAVWDDGSSSVHYAPGYTTSIQGALNLLSRVRGKSASWAVSYSGVGFTVSLYGAREEVGHHSLAVAICAALVAAQSYAPVENPDAA